MVRLRGISDTAAYYGCHPRTPTNWLAQQLIRGYRRAGSTEVLLDLDEIEQAFLDNPRRMRDPRRKYGGARIVTLPAQSVRAEVVQPEAER